MKKLIISLFITMLIILIGWLLKDIAIPNVNATDYRFILVHNEGHLKIYCDKKTKVMYLVKSIYKGGGITLLVDADGKPLLYEGEQ